MPMTDSTSQSEPVCPDVDRDDSAQPMEDPDRDRQPEVDSADAGLPSSPELDDDKLVVTPPDADDVPGSAAG